MLLRRAAAQLYSAPLVVRWTQQRCASFKRLKLEHTVDKESSLSAAPPNGFFPGVFDLDASTSFVPPPRDTPRLTFDTYDDQVKARSQQHESSVDHTTLDAASGPDSPTVRELSNVLRFERASKNLTLTDFRRLTPQGKHIEGWSITKGDVIEVIPDRHPWTLEQNNMYYLIFSSAESARFYFDHANRLHALARQAANGNSFFGEVLADVQRVVENVDEAVAAFTVMSPAQNMALQHLHHPLSNHHDRLIREGGLPALRSQRPRRRPWELRLTLDGPRVDAVEIRQAMRNAASARGLPWSGDHRHHLTISMWDPRKSDRGSEHAEYRQDKPVYIVGFDTEYAAENFLHYWHRRQLAEHGDRTLSSAYNDPPIVELEPLY